MPTVTANIRALASSERGATALEYALIAAIIGVIIIGAFQGVGTSLLQNFDTLVSAEGEAPEPMAVVDSRRPAPVVAKTPSRPHPPTPVTQADESPPTFPSASDSEESGEEMVAREAGPLDREPGIEPSGPALGPGDTGVPMTAVSIPPGLERSHQDQAALNTPAPVPPGRESSGESAEAWNRADAKSESATSPGPAPAPGPAFINPHQKAAIRSGFILLLWLGFAIGLINLIWRIATRKAYEKEVEEELEDWQPASFGSS